MQNADSFVFTISMESWKSSRCRFFNDFAWISAAIIHSLNSEPPFWIDFGKRYSIHKLFGINRIIVSWLRIHYTWLNLNSNNLSDQLEISYLLIYYMRILWHRMSKRIQHKDDVDDYNDNNNNNHDV